MKFLSMLSMCRDEVTGICLFVLLLNDMKFASLLKNYGFCLEWFHIVILAQRHTFFFFSWSKCDHLKYYISPWIGSVAGPLQIVKVG